MYHYFENGSKWIAGPKPKLNENYIVSSDNKKDKHVNLLENEILFEAATVSRLGKDLLYLVSPSGNRLGSKWLQNILGDKYKVHTTNKIYNDTHIDSTVICLKKDLVLLNATRVNKDNCPPIFNKWKKIWLNKIMPYPKEILRFHQNTRLKIYKKLIKLGFNSNLNKIHSEWVGINLLSLDPKTVIVEKNQTYLIKKLEKYGINCIPISFRYSHIMGGIHCCTLDTVRDSRYETS